MTERPRSGGAFLFLRLVSEILQRIRPSGGVYLRMRMKQQPEPPQRPAVTFRLEDEQIDQLRDRARRNERTVSQEVRLIVRQALEVEAEAA